LDVFQQASWLEINPAPVVLPPYLQNTLDRGEASVIQTALQQGVKRVCIDETAGRRVARLRLQERRVCSEPLDSDSALGGVISARRATKRELQDYHEGSR